MLNTQTDYWLPDLPVANGSAVAVGVILVIALAMLVGIVVTKILYSRSLDESKANDSTQRLFGLHFGFIIALIVSVFVMFIVGIIGQAFESKERTESLQSWASEVYGIELSDEGANDLAPSIIGSSAETVAVEYEGETVAVRLVRYDEVSGSYILVRNDSLEPLKASR